MPRFRRRISIRYSKDGEKYVAAYASDVGPHGFFVVTRQVEPPGTPLRVLVDFPDGGAGEIQAQVRWTKRVPASLHSVVPGGFGVKIVNAPEEWFRFCAKLGT
jgi:hypothetical protein